MARYASFRELVVWQKGMDLAERVHMSTAGFPPKDLYGLGIQVRKASVSIPSNVAEGFARHSRRMYRAHVAIALGSEAEVQTQLELCRRLRLIDAVLVNDLLADAAEVGRMLNGLWRSLAIASAAEAVCYSLILGAVMWGLMLGA